METDLASTDIWHFQLRFLVKETSRMLNVPVIKEEMKAGRKVVFRRQVEEVGFWGLEDQ